MKRTRRILISLMTIALVGALMGGGIFAYFSDAETSTGNTFTAGTLNLNLDAGYLDLESCNVTEAIGTTTDPELADEPTSLDTTQLGNYLLVHMFVDANNNGSWDAGETDILGTNAIPVAINTIAASYNLNLSLAASGGTSYITLRWSVATATGNRIQGDSVTLNITFELQQRSED